MSEYSLPDVGPKGLMADPYPGPHIVKPPAYG